MKKVIFIMMSAMVISFSACGNKTDATSTVNDSDSIVTVDSLDSVNVDTLTVCEL